MRLLISYTSSYSFWQSFMCSIVPQPWCLGSSRWFQHTHILVFWVQNHMPTAMHWLMIHWNSLKHWARVISLHFCYLAIFRVILCVRRQVVIASVYESLNRHHKTAIKASLLLNYIGTKTDKAAIKHWIQKEFLKWLCMLVTGFWSIDCFRKIRFNDHVELYSTCWYF